MNIGILTQPLQNNYGGLLQNYALQTALIQLGHAPITIDQKPRSFPSWYRFLGKAKSYLNYFLGSTKKPKYLLSIKEKEIIEKNTHFFIDHYIKHTPKCDGTDAFRKEVIYNNVEALIVGSDQCWRPSYNDYIEDMFLLFADNMQIKRRVAYAASFGTDVWEFSPELTDTCSKLAKKFDLITVREDSGVKLCADYLRVEAFHVLDPTMLLTRNDYISLINNYGEKKSEGSLFNYILDPTEAKLNFINKISYSLGLKPFQVLPRHNEDHRTREDVKHDIEGCVYPSPIKWLRAFMDSEMTIVDSFHGMVFSIIFNKPFWVIGNKERGLSRFLSLLKMFELEDRLVSDDKLESLEFTKPIHWAKVNSLVEGNRKQSIELLKGALS